MFLVGCFQSKQKQFDKQQLDISCMSCERKNDFATITYSQNDYIKGNADIHLYKKVKLSKCIYSMELNRSI